MSMKSIQSLMKYSNQSIMVTFTDGRYEVYRIKYILEEVLLHLPEDDPNFIKIRDFFEKSHLDNQISKRLYERYNLVMTAKSMNKQ